VKRQNLYIVVLSLCLISCFSRQGPPADVIRYGAKGGNSQGIIQVYKGDTLYNLSKLYRVPLQSLIQTNKLSAPYIISVGQRLKIPEPQTYKAQNGDSYSKIARLFDLSVTELVRLNKSTSPHIVRAGQVIYLSQSKSSPKVATQALTTKPTVSSEKIKQVRKKSKINNPPPRSGGKFGRPVSGKILSSYGAKKGGLFNDGINIAAPRGTGVRSSETGVVAYVGNELKGFGNLILIKHQGGFVTAYGHMEKTLVKRGQTVKKGQTIGTIGSSGNVQSPQVHFEIRKNGKAVNPTQYL
jgi:murein DD-endopeptidase MepM/ murein hydrolase activator NlpD